MAVGPAGAMSLVAARSQKFGEYAVNKRSKERKTGADNGDVAFRGGPVGCSYVAVWGGLDRV